MRYVVAKSTYFRNMHCANAVASQQQLYMWYELQRWFYLCIVSTEALWSCNPYDELVQVVDKSMDYEQLLSIMHMLKNGPEIGKLEKYWEA